MKTLYKNLIKSAAGAGMCLFLAFPAVAQHTPSSGGSGSGGGGGSHSSGSSGGGGSVSSARSSGGGGSSVSRSSSGSSGVARSSAGGSRSGGGGGVGSRGVTASPQRPTYVYKQGGGLVRNTAPAIGIRTGVVARGNN